MTEEEVKALRRGDEVYWTDPDDGACSRHYVILVITVRGDCVSIMDLSGDTLECFAEELS